MIPFYLPPDSLCNLPGAIAIRLRRQQHKLIPTPASRHIRCPCISPDNSRHLPQEGIAFMMPEAVVYRLKSVKVNHNQRQRYLTPVSTDKFPFYLFHKISSIVKVCQAISESEFQSMFIQPGVFDCHAYLIGNGAQHSHFPIRELSMTMAADAYYT